MLIRLASILIIFTMVENNDLVEKKLRGSGGYVLAKITEAEQKKGNLGGPDLFLAGVGRLGEDRFSKYYCSKCEKEYPGSPKVKYETPNEDLGEGIKLLETGEYRCAGCDNTISQYRKFSSPGEPTDPTLAMKQHKNSHDDDKKTATFYLPDSNSGTGSSNNLEQSPTTHRSAIASNPSWLKGVKQDGFLPLKSLVGMAAYDSEAMSIGTVLELGLRKTSDGKADLSMKIGSGNELSNTLYIEVLWKNISKIGDIILLSSKPSSTNDIRTRCTSCGYENQEIAVYCEECGRKLN